MKKKIASFRDLKVYQKSYDAAITVIKQIIPKLPREEKFDLADQLRRSVKAIPRLIPLLFQGSPLFSFLSLLKGEDESRPLRTGAG